MKKLAALASLSLLAGLGVYTLGGSTVPAAKGAEATGPVMHRLTQEQYRNSIRDVFGPSVEIGGRFEPDPRDEGLIAVGAGRATVTGTGIENYQNIANGIAEQVVDETHRGQLIPCEPRKATKADDKCARQFLGDVGRRLFRRSLTKGELAAYTGLAGDGADQLGNFYDGLKLALSGMLVAPQFLFWSEEAEPDPENPGEYRLTAASKAMRLSFMLTNSTPDDELLRAVAAGELDSPEGLDRQIDRLLASDRLEDGVEAFFTDMFQFATFDVLAKDTALYPGFTRAAAADAQEQTLRTVVDLLVREDGDYRDIFTTRKTFMTRVLASIYHVPFNKPGTEPGRWTEFTFPEYMPQAGILTHASFVTLHSHPGISSPTLRGKAVRELFLCQTVPPPPADVDFSAFEQSKSGEATTARDRLSIHNTNPGCASCHTMMDPLGFALENYDTAGAFRLTENGLPIDASGMYSRAEFRNADEMGQVLHDSPQVLNCLMQRAYAYGAGRDPTIRERRWMRSAIQPAFEESGYRMRALFRELLRAPEFYRVEVPDLTAGDEVAEGPAKSREDAS